MAVKHCSWEFDVIRARVRLNDARSFDDLLTPRMASAAAAARHNPDLANFLTMARYSPTDTYTWCTILEPTSDEEREFAAGARMMVLVGEVVQHERTMSAPPWFIEQLLGEVGWRATRVALALRGLRHETFFIAEAPQLRLATALSGSWLQGGWLDALTAAVLRRDLEDSEAEVSEHVPALAARLSKDVGLSTSELEVMLRAGIRDLTAMLEAPRGDIALWIIQD